MAQNPSWEANRFFADQEITHILWYPEVYCRIQKCPPPVPFLTQIDNTEIEEIGKMISPVFDCTPYAIPDVICCFIVHKFQVKQSLKVWRKESRQPCQAF